MASPLDSLSPTQVANARAIVGETKREGLPLSAAQIAVTVAIVEAGLLNQANSSVPGSLSIPHDKVGNDHDSVGLFQQRTSWGTIAQRMNPATATQLFLARLPAGWQSQNPGVVAQQIQGSAFPDRYGARYALGSTIAAALWPGVTPGNSNGVNAVAGTDPNNPGVPQWKNSAGKPISAPPAGTYKAATDSQGHATYVPTVDPTTITSDQAAQIAAWVHLVNPDLYQSLPTDWHAKIPGTAPGFDTAAAVLVHAYEQALQGNGLDTGGATPGFDIPNPLQFLSDIFKWLTNKDNWIRIGFYALGGIILLMVAVLWFRGTDTGQSMPTVVPIPL